MNENQIVIYKTSDGQTAIDVRMENETVWLTQAQMTELFQKDRTVITRHINNLFDEKELDMKSNVHFLHIPFSDKPVKIYSLDVIISVGYRVKSQRGVQFRQWANSVTATNALPPRFSFGSSTTTAYFTVRMAASASPTTL